MAKITRETVTPTVAEKWLMANRSNRPIRQHTVNAYARDMMNGKWDEDSMDGIISFDTNGCLVNGQHRLRAIIRSGATLRLYVAHDVKGVIFDRGATRSTRDTLIMQGYDKELVNHDSIAVCRLRFAILFNIDKPTDPEITDYLAKNSAFIIDATKLSRAGGQRSICRKTPAQFAAFCALKCGESKEDIEHFFTVANTGYATDNSQSAAITFRNYLINRYGGNNGNRVERHTLCMMCQEAIRDFIKKKPRRISYKGQTAPYSDKLKQIEMR